MSHRPERVVAFALTVALAFAVAAAFIHAVTPTATAASQPRIVAVYPDPVAHEDAGEFVVVSFPHETNLSGWTLTDGETTANLPPRRVSGRIAFSTAPATTRNLTDYRVLKISDDVSLTNDGETVHLRKNGTVATVTYPEATEGELWLVESEEWRPLGATDRPAVSADATRARTFVLPDADRVPVETVRSAEDRVLLAGYTFTSRRMAAALAAAERRGVQVRVLVDDGPVGGMTRREATVLESLAEGGVDVEVIGGARARYEFHHAKYAVVDDRALVLTENWKPSGTGGHGSRGWGVVVPGETARELAEVFRADAGWNDTRSWEQFRRGQSFEPSSPPNETYPTRFSPETVPVESVTVATAPGNAESAVVSLLRSANRSVRVEQVSVGGPRQPFVRATLAAARRGVEVRILLSGAWYVEEENRELVRWLNERSAAEGLPLEARVADPRGFEKIHAKGVVVDGEHVVVGSLNWNNHSARQNREVAVVLHGEKAGAYYGRVFDADWRASGGSRLPVGLAVAVAAGLAGAAVVARREVGFDGG
ncbi:phospholipase D-like domain-containing protein [Halomicrococcus gelatinilyticus]|uniref:phospholipase D-like domain-containing protein n=1 Tax=Halomicrococcus gelatinilyticus TaxID=1702103 RepID=UPI002E1533D7